MGDPFLNGGAATPGCGNFFGGQIVQQWDQNNEVEVKHFGIDPWRHLSSREQEAMIEKEADLNGIERPKSHTVSFHYNPRVEAHHFGKNHPMKPWRLTLTKQLVLSYGLHYAMDLFESRPATKDEIGAFHHPDYLDFLSRFVELTIIQKIS